jgi:hypothetical protein
MGLTLLFFLVAFLAYYFTNHRFTPFNNPVRLADAFLHGRLDIANGEDLHWMDWAIYNGKYYVVEPPMPAIVLLPGVFLFGTAINQTLVSVVIGGITASAIYRLMRGLTEKVTVQIWLTLLFAFGTIYWWAVTHGGIWHFSHTVAVLFMFLAIHETLVSKRPFLAGLFLGAAYLSRLPTILAFPFFVIMFSDQWLPETGDKSLLRRIDFRPLAQFGLGLGIFVVLSFLYNYLRFENPWHVSYSIWKSAGGVPAVWYQKGMVHPSYIAGHLAVVFMSLPIIQSKAPYILPSWGGMAIWATTPPFIYALFAGIKTKWVLLWGLVLLIAGVVIAIPFARGAPGFISRFSRDFPDGLNFPGNLEKLPFVLLIALAVWTGFKTRNRLILACWSAIIPIALVHFTHGLRPPQFGYRWALDFYPFLLLLTWVAIGDKIKWHHMILITLAVAINLWGVLWIHQFQANGFLGLQWVRY